MGRVVFNISRDPNIPRVRINSEKRQTVCLKIERMKDNEERWSRFAYWRDDYGIICRYENCVFKRYSRCAFNA